jgi:hypothetical protein
LRLGKLLPRIGRNYFYLMHLSYGGEDRAELWDYAYRNNLIGLDYEGVDEDWLTIPESNRNKIVPTRDWYRQFKLFCEDMRVGDCVLVTAGMVPSYLLGVGLVDSPYFFDEKYREKFFGHVRYVRWILKYRYDDKVRINAYFRKTLLRIDSKCKLWNLINLNLKIPTNVERTILVTRKAKIVRHMPSKGEIQRAINKLRSKSNSDTTNIDREIKKLNLLKSGELPRRLVRPPTIKAGSNFVDIVAEVNLIESNEKIDIKPLYVVPTLGRVSLKSYQKNARKFRKLLTNIEREFGVESARLTRICIDDTPGRDAFVYNNNILCNLLGYRKRKSYSYWLITLAREFTYLIHPKRDMKYMNLFRELLIKAIGKRKKS